MNFESSILLAVDWSKWGVLAATIVVMLTIVLLVSRRQFERIRKWAETRGLSAANRNRWGYERLEGKVEGVSIQVRWSTGRHMRCVVEALLTFKLPRKMVIRCGDPAGVPDVATFSLIRTGAEEFDSTFVVSADDDAAAAELLEHRGLRAALLLAAADFDAVGISDGAVNITFRNGAMRIAAIDNAITHVLQVTEELQAARENAA